MAVLAGCALLPGSPAPGHRTADPAPPSTSTTAPSSPAPSPSETPSAGSAAPDDVEQRADALFASVGAERWSDGLGMDAGPLPAGTDPGAASDAGILVQRWMRVALQGDGVLQASSPRAAQEAYLQQVPDGVREAIAAQRKDPEFERSQNFVLMNSLAPGVELLAPPRFHTATSVVQVLTGAYAGDLRTNVGVVALYPVSYRERDALIPVLRYFSVDTTPQGTVDDVFPIPAQWVSACDPLQDGSLAPELQMPVELLRQGVSSMAANASVLAESRLADPTSEPALQGVATRTCS